MALEMYENMLEFSGVKGATIIELSPCCLDSRLSLNVIKTNPIPHRSSLSRGQNLPQNIMHPCAMKFYKDKLVFDYKNR